MLSRDEMIRCLNEGACTVHFTKVSTGENRVMTATLNGRLIPKDKAPTSSGPTNDETIRCFDLDKKEWRSFRVDSVTRFMDVIATFYGDLDNKE